MLARFRTTITCPSILLCSDDPVFFEGIARFSGTAEQALDEGGAEAGVFIEMIALHAADRSFYAVRPFDGGMSAIDINLFDEIAEIDGFGWIIFDKRHLRDAAIRTDDPAILAIRTDFDDHFAFAVGDGEISVFIAHFGKLRDGVEQALLIIREKIKGGFININSGHF